MAEINIERKKGPRWPWILGILALIVLAFIFVSRNDKKRANNEQALEVDASKSNESSEKSASAAKKSESSKKASVYVDGASSIACIQQFSNFINENDASVKEGLAHEYTHDGLKYLSCSLRALIDKDKDKQTNQELSTKGDQLNRSAAALRSNAESKEHPAIIKKAFNETVEVMEELQKKNFPTLKDKVKDVRKAAKAFDDDESTLEQKDKVATFFKKASEALQAMKDEESKG